MKIYSNKIVGSKLLGLFYLTSEKNYVKFKNIYKLTLKVLYLKKMMNFLNKN